MAVRNIHLTGFLYSHYDFHTMKKVPSGISPVIAINKEAAKSLYRQVYEAIAKQLWMATCAQDSECHRLECWRWNWESRAFQF